MKLRLIYESEYDDLDDTDEFQDEFDQGYECQYCGFVDDQNQNDAEARQELAARHGSGVLPSGWYERPIGADYEGQVPEERCLFCPECHSEGRSDVRYEYLPHSFFANARVDPVDLDQFIMNYDWDSDEDRAPGESDESWEAYKKHRRKMLELE
jgi:hypothetical protein